MRVPYSASAYAAARGSPAAAFVLAGAGALASASAEGDVKGSISEPAAKASVEQAGSSSADQKQTKLESAEPSVEPPKKKRRVALTRVGDVD